MSQRRAERRRRFIDAAIEVFGTSGYATSSVSSVCARAGLSRTHFYVEFADREALLIAVLNEIQDDARRRIIAALRDSDGDVTHRSAQALAAFLESVAVDSRRARILFVAAVGASDAVEEQRLAQREVWADSFIDVMRLYRPELSADSALERLHATGFVGALSAIAYHWSEGGPRRHSLDVVVDILNGWVHTFATA